jgi:LmbE family N-acetylglucosaminyl deacetylase
MAMARQQLRASRYDAIYISPHMDDAGYSCGGRILQQRQRGLRVLVVTLFGTGEPVPGNEDVQHRFADYKQRAAEEEAVMAALDADFIWLNLPELLFRPKPMADVFRFALPCLPLAPSAIEAQLFARLLAIFQAHLVPGGEVHFPHGVGFHPDHRIVTDVGRTFHALGLIQVVFYEDVPYSTVPAFVSLRARTLGLSASAPLLTAAQSVSHFVFRSFGLWAKLAVPLLWLYFAFLLFFQAISRKEDRAPGEPPPVPDRLDIADVIHRKVAMMRLYPSQTAFFFALDDTLYDYLRRDGGFFEYSWRYPPMGTNSPRLSADARAHATAALQPLAAAPLNAQT